MAETVVAEKQNFQVGSPAPETVSSHSEDPKIKNESRAFTIVALVAQLAFIALFAGCVKYSPEDAAANEDYHATGFENGLHVYPYYSDVHVMIFIGFGFLMTFMKKYGFGAVSLNFLLSAVVLQWAILNNGFWNCVHAKKWERIPISTPALVEGDFAAGSVMITFGAVIGKLSHLQMLIVALVEIMFYSLNKVLLERYIKAADIGGSMVIHTFGAYFGLAIAWVTSFRQEKLKDNKNYGTTYTTDLFSMIGTIFLWIYWPSFNAALATRPELQERAIINTVLSLAGCTVTTFLLSALFRHGGKLEMIDIQNATLAGGVSVGAAAHMNLHPAGAISVGFSAAVISCLGFRFLQPALEKLWLYDSCGVHNLHGMPGVFGGIVSAIASAAATSSMYTEGQREETWIGGYSRFKQGGLQMAALFMTLGIAIFSGTLTGICVGLPLRRKEFKPYHDSEHFNLPHDIQDD